MSFENREGSVEEWRRTARAEVERRLSFHPKRGPLDLRVISTVERDGYRLTKISFAGPGEYRIPAFLLVPSRGKPPFPALVALHDHGGFFYFGKEKLVDLEDPHPALKPFKERYYGGRSYADELARRGFVVLVTDAFYWGERRIQYEQPPPELQSQLAGLEPGQVAYVTAVNRFLGTTASTLNTWLSFAGTSWLGIVSHDDRRSVDLLSSLPEVDRNRIGCMGLSGGGYRSTYLAGMDSRIRAAVITGWMTSLPATLDIPYSVHTNLFDAFGLHAYLDHPDIASLAAPDCALFVQNCARDRLFTPAGMEQAAEKIKNVYLALKRPERFQTKSYDNAHEFNLIMQADAFAWLEKWLKQQ